MRVLTFAVALLVFCALSGLVHPSQVPPNYHGVIGLDGKKMVPPTTTSAVGQGRLQFATLQNELLFDLSVTGFASSDPEVLEVTLHMGLPPTAGALVTALEFESSTTTAPAPTPTLFVQLSGAQIIPTEHIEHVLAGQTYIQICSVNECIRGQVVLEEDPQPTHVGKVSLSGKSVVPPTTTTETGVATLTYFASELRLVVDIQQPFKNCWVGLHGVADPTENAGIISTLKPQGTTTVLFRTSSDVESFLAGKMYIEVHSSIASSDIRGQCMVKSLGNTDSSDSGSLEPLQETHSATLFMTGNQMVPPQHTSAVATLTLSYFQAGGYLSWVLESDVSDLTSLMLHGPAFEDANGPVIMSFSLLQMEGNSAYGDFAVDEFSGELLRGQVYAVLHSQSAPNGLLRAQLVLLDHDFLNDESPVDFGQQTVLKPVDSSSNYAAQPLTVQYQSESGILILTNEKADPSLYYALEASKAEVSAFTFQEGTFTIRLSQVEAGQLLAGMMQVHAHRSDLSLVLSAPLHIARGGVRPSFSSSSSSGGSWWGSSSSSSGPWWGSSSSSSSGPWWGSSSSSSDGSWWGSSGSSSGGSWWGSSSSSSGGSWWGSSSSSSGGSWWGSSSSSSGGSWWGSSGSSSGDGLSTGAIVAIILAVLFFVMVIFAALIWFFYYLKKKRSNSPAAMGYSLTSTDDLF